MSHEFVSFLAIGIPFLAIVGGILMALMRMRGEQRLAELARRERIAAIERGVDLDKLPPAGSSDSYSDYGHGNGRLRRAHGLMIGGAVSIAAGIGLAAMLITVEPEKAHYVIGLLPFMVGLALVVSSIVVWPRK